MGSAFANPTLCKLKELRKTAKIYPVHLRGWGIQNGKWVMIDE